MRFKKSPQLPGAGRTWAGHHHGSHTPTSTGAILLSKMACNPNILAASVHTNILNDVTAAPFSVSFSQLPVAKKHQKRCS